MSTNIKLVWQVTTLAVMFALSTTSSFAFTKHRVGLDFFGKQQSSFSTPDVAPDMREYRAALSRPSMLPMDQQNAAHYVPSICKDGEYTWTADRMPIKIFISSGDKTSGYRPVFRTFITKAFDEWVEASKGKLSWLEVSSADKADITISWTSSVTERPEGTEAGKTSCFTRLNTVTRKGTIFGAKMQLLTELPDRKFSDEEVEKTCLHEAGHALGLQGHSPSRTDIMYYAVSPAQTPVLTDRDRNTMSALYEGYPTANAMALGGKQSR